MLYPEFDLNNAVARDGKFIWGMVNRREVGERPVPKRGDVLLRAGAVGKMYYHFFDGNEWKSQSFYALCNFLSEEMDKKVCSYFNSWGSLVPQEATA